MKKVYCLVMQVILFLIIFGAFSVSAHGKRNTRKKKKKAQTSVTLTQSPLIALPSSLENGLMTDLLHDAQTKAKELELEVAEKTKLLNQQAEERYRTMQEEINQRTQEIQELAKKQSEELANKFKKQAEQVEIEVQQTSTALRQQAAQQVASLFNQAEEEAIRRKREAEEEELKRKRQLEEKELKRRRKEREKIITKSLEQQQEKQSLISSSLLGIDSLPPLKTSTSLPIDSSWKEKTSQEFHDNMALMKKIILEGETESEAQDFMKRFSRQSRWFDTTLGNTAYVCDEHYKEIVKRSTRLRNVVNAQESADRFLTEMAEEKDLTSDEVKKVRLAILYELNAKINRIATQGSRTSIDNNEVKKIVTQAIKETVSDVEKKPPHLIAVRRTMPSSSAQDVVSNIPLTISSTIQNDLDALSQEIKDLKKALTHEIKKRKNTKKKVKEKDSKILELEERLAQAQEHISRYKEQMNDSGQKLSLEVQQTEQSKEASKEHTLTINRLQVELDQAKKDVEEISGKASSSLALMKEEIDGIATAEAKLRKKFSKSLEQEKKINIELERKALEVLEENKSLTKKISHAQKETAKAVSQAKQQFKGKFEDVSKKLVTKEIDLQQITNKASKLENKVQKSQKQILELTQDKLQLVQDKENVIKQTENRIKNQFKSKVQETEKNNVNLEIEKRKADSSIAHLKDKVRQIEQEKSQAIAQTSRELQDSFKKSLADQEHEKQVLQETMQAQKDETLKEIEALKRKSLQDKEAAVQQAKNELTAVFKPKIENQEKANLELEITTRKALEETNKVKSDLINAYKEKDAAIEQTTVMLKKSFKPKLGRAHQETIEAEVKAQVALNKSDQLNRKVKNLEQENAASLEKINTIIEEKDLALSLASREKDDAVTKAVTKVSNSFKPQLQQARKKQFEAEINEQKALTQSSQLDRKVKNLEQEKAHVLQQINTLKTEKDEALSLASREKDDAVTKAVTKVSNSFKPQLQQARKKQFEAEINEQKSLTQSSQLDRKVKNLEQEKAHALQQINTLKTEKDEALSLASREKDDAVTKAVTKVSNSFKPQLQQARKEQFEAEINARKMSDKADNLKKEVNILTAKQEATKNSSRSLLERSHKQALIQEIEVNRLNTKLKKAESNSIPIDLLDLPTLEMLHQQLNNK